MFHKSIGKAEGCAIKWRDKGCATKYCGSRGMCHKVLGELRDMAGSAGTS